MAKPPPTPPLAPPGPWIKAAMGVLIGLGVLLMGGGLGLWIAGGEAGISTTSSTASSSTSTSGNQTTGAASNAETTGDSSSSQKQSISSEQTVTTDPGDPSDRSDALTLTLLGLGASLLVIGMFFPRISKITLGTTTVELNPAQVGAVVKKALKSTPRKATDPSAVREIVVELLDAATPEGVEPDEAFREEFIAEAVEAATE